MRLFRLIKKAIIKSKKYFGDIKHKIEFNIDENQIILYFIIPIKQQKGKNFILKAHKKLKKFDKYWWIKNIKKARGELCITLDYE